MDQDGAAHLARHEEHLEQMWCGLECAVAKCALSRCDLGAHTESLARGLAFDCITAPMGGVWVCVYLHSGREVWLHKSQAEARWEAPADEGEGSGMWQPLQDLVDMHTAWVV